MSPISLDTAWIQLRKAAAITPSKSRLFSTHSKRGTNAVSLLPSYLADARAVETYCPETAPDGALQLGVAENQMLEDLLVPALREFTPSFEAEMIYYQPTKGRPGVCRAFCSYLERLLSVSMNPDNLVVGAGCNAVLENLCFCLASPGQGVMIPTPYYAAFEFDLVARAGLEIVPVKTLTGENDGDIPVQAYYPTPAILEAAYQRSCEDGVEPRILLLSHPNNPLGVCYPPEVVQDCIDWCRSRRVHLVSDEIYAGSVYGDGSKFKSALQLAGNDLGDYIHLVYALSKDFALSGLRVGAVYTENSSIQLPLQKLNDLCQISSHTQDMVETMLSSKQDNGKYWTDTFLAKANARIRARSEALQSCLDDCGIPYLTPDSGLFLWMNFSEFLPPLDPADLVEGEELPESMQARERELYMSLMKEHGLLFTPGLSMRHARPGFFRCVYTAATDDEFALGLERIRKFCKQQRSSS